MKSNHLVILKTARKKDAKKLRKVEMFTSFKVTSILIAILCLISANSAKRSKKSKLKFGPGGMSHDDSTNCSTFSKYARFNPYSVLYEKWFVFYYWDVPKPLTTYVFTFPTANHTKHLKRILDGNTILPVMWSARQILMEDNRNEISLLVEREDRGVYWQYPLHKVNKQITKITPIDIRLKQTGDNRIIGLMDCVHDTLMVMSKVNDVPPKNRLLEEASRLGYKGRKGKSYLYQGHEWVPIPEDDETKYWQYDKNIKSSQDSKESSKEVQSVEQSSEEGETKPTKKPEDTVQKKKGVDDTEVFNEDAPEPSCIKIEPELWNDPKPRPLFDPKILITKEDLNNPDTLLLHENDNKSNDMQENDLTIESNKTENVQDNINITAIEDRSLNKKQENNLSTKSNKVDSEPDNTHAADTQNSSLNKKQKFEKESYILHNALDSISTIDTLVSPTNNNEENKLVTESDNIHTLIDSTPSVDALHSTESENKHTITDITPVENDLHSSSNNKQDKITNTESENLREDQDQDSTEPTKPYNKPKTLEPESESSKQKPEHFKQGCGVCYQSEPSPYMQTILDSYKAEHTHPVKKLEDEKPPSTDIPAPVPTEDEVPQESKGSDENITVLTLKSLDDVS